jgi:hypothetical protein
MRRLAAIVGFLSVAFVASGATVVVDNFNNTSMPGPLVVFGAPATFTDPGVTGVIGGQRDILVSRTSGTGFILAFIGSGVLNFVSTANTAGFVNITYSGTGSSFSTPQDVTDGGNNLGFEFLITSATPGLSLFLTLNSAAGTSTSLTTITSSIAGGRIFVPFTSLTPTIGSGANLSSLTSIVLGVGDLTGNPVGTVANVDFLGATVPEPSTYALMGLGLISAAMLRRRKA